MLPTEFVKNLSLIKPPYFLDGYVRLLDIHQSEEITSICENAAIFEGGVAFATTAFADVFVWDGQYIMLYKFKDGRVEVVSDGYDYFCDDMRDTETLESFYEIELYADVKKNVGDIHSDECYAFLPLLSLGGEKSANNAEKAKIKEHLTLIVNSL